MSFGEVILGSMSYIGRRLFFTFHYTFLLELSFTATAKSTEVVWKIQNSKYSKFKFQNIQNSKFIFPQQPSGLGFQSLYPGLNSLRGTVLAECTEVVWVTSVEHYFSVFTTLSYWNWASPQRRSPRRYYEKFKIQNSQSEIQNSNSKDQSSKFKIQK